MKHCLLPIVAVCCAGLLSGCWGTKVDFSVPSGFSHGARKDVIVMKFALPQSNAQLTASQQNQLIELPKTTLIQNKRFLVLADGKGDLTGTETYDFEVRPYVDMLQASGRTKAGFGCVVKLDLRLNDKASGAYADGFSGGEIVGASSSVHVRRMSDGAVSGVNLSYLFFKAYNQALAKMNAKIKEVYPICGTVLNIKNKTKSNVPQTEFLVDRGTNYGIEASDEFVIYYLDSNEAITPVAVGQGMIGRDRSQITVTAWNLEDSEVINEILPRIRKNDKTLLGKLFFVCRQVKNK